QLALGPEIADHGGTRRLGREDHGQCEQRQKARTRAGMLQGESPMRCWMPLRRGKRGYWRGLWKRKCGAAGRMGICGWVKRAGARSVPDEAGLYSILTPSSMR